jgi:hypothetical protein
MVANGFWSAPMLFLQLAALPGMYFSRAWL